jgi:hypothetical protein
MVELQFVALAMRVRFHLNNDFLKLFQKTLDIWGKIEFVNEYT